jgi:hypothetical protein
MQAQEDTTDTVVAAADSSVSVYDTTNDGVTVSPSDEEDYDDESKDTLFFLRKEDTASLNDSSTIQWRKVPDSIISALKNDDAFWYADKDMQKKKEEKPASDSWFDRFLFFLFRLLTSPLFLLFIKLIVIGGVLAIIIIFFVQNKMNIFGSSKGPAITHNDTEGEIDNIFDTDLKAAIEKAAQNENYRLAIRLSYLHLLKTFSQNELIQYRKDATNLEYLTQLHTQPHYKAFFKVTRDYEYAWYGEVTVNKAQYESVQAEFRDLYLKTGLNY